MTIDIDKVKFDERGLVPAVIQDAQTREVLTLAYMNHESLRRTLETNETWLWSRSRNELWHKGATSGHTQQVVDMKIDCDGDTLVVLVNPSGPACHTGARSCFAGSDAEAPFSFTQTLDQLYSLIVNRQRERPAGSYTTYLFEQGLDKILKKVGEESTETVVAAKNESQEALVAEASDLIYHLLVLLVVRGISLDQIRDELIARHKGGEKK
jgi:phosphoribosyl-ATP pyrophosphohydrolase/phosphoribosyl-AMP cyclohydrolase